MEGALSVNPSKTRRMLISRSRTLEPLFENGAIAPFSCLAGIVGRVLTR